MFEDKKNCISLEFITLVEHQLVFFFSEGRRKITSAEETLVCGFEYTETSVN